MTCTDSYGDGWHGGYLEISGNQYCSQFSTGTEWIESMPNDQFVPEPGKYISNDYVVAKITNYFVSNCIRPILILKKLNF